MPLPETMRIDATPDVLADVIVDNQLLARTRRRLDYFIPNYLEKLVHGSRNVVSVGCGLGYDVHLLLHLGYDAYGLDPGTRTRAWQSYPAETRNRLTRAFAEDLPFGRERFDFAYSLEVIEHVGCQDGVWKLLPDVHAIRTRFLESCLDMVRPGGRLFLSTSNRACPLDPGHVHHYTRITDFAGRKLGLQLTMPWHPKNFVWSIADIRRLLGRSRYAGRCTIRAVSTAAYPAFARSGAHSGWKQGLARAYLRAVDVPRLRTSFLNPILAVVVEKHGPSGLA